MCGADATCTSVTTARHVCRPILDRPLCRGVCGGRACPGVAAMATREEQRREHNEQKELESLRRVFESLDKTRCGKIGFKEVNDQLVKLEYRAKRVEVRARRD